MGSGEGLLIKQKCNSNKYLNEVISPSRLFEPPSPARGEGNPSLTI
jgi:hypothetical protein